MRHATGKRGIVGFGALGVGTGVLLVLLATAGASEPGLVAKSPTATSVTLHWTAPGDDGGVGTAAQYDIRFSTAVITEANWAQATQIAGEPTPRLAGTAESYTIIGLSSSTTYYFAIKAADEAANWSALSNVVTVTTADNVPPAPVGDLTGGTS